MPGLGVGLAKGIEDEAENIAKQFTNLENAVLCFDDLERIDRTLSIQQVLGYINTNFIEHENIKLYLYLMKINYMIMNILS